jgi:SAM-dependent MidA family methyltransferase
MRPLKPSAHNTLSLPIPSDDALAASQSLVALIHEEIAQHNGCISFARYMELALYAPRYGYYSGGAAKLGPEGDFTTSPEMTPLFGATMAQFAASLFPKTSSNVMEFGAGSGKLAFDFLTECQLSNISVERYFIVELSGELRARQEDKLKQFQQVRWLDQMPTAFSGVVIGNEVLDAMPIELIIKTHSGWQLLGVSSHIHEANQYSLVEMPSNEEYASQLALQIPDSDMLPIGYMTEVHPMSIAFMRSVSHMLKNGFAENQQAGVAIWLDYGFPAHEYYHAQRDKGTLMCHYRHHSHPDPFYLPGLQDITAHVDFTTMAKTCLDSDVDLLTYCSQAGFLLEAGITNALSRIHVEDSQSYLPAANAVQKLVSPAEMGELFKVIVVGCGIELPDSYRKYDRSHRL